MSAKVTSKAVSQVTNQLPQFISDSYPLYEKFLKHYYEFVETLCVYFSAVESYTTLFTIGETVTGQTSGATAKVKAFNSISTSLKVFLEPTNDLSFSIGEVFIGSTSNSRGTITKLNRKPINGTKTFSDLINPDLTSDGILDWFKKELYPNIRNTAKVDLRYFLKHLKEFYRSRGSEKSYRTLFRALYGQDTLDFYYPKTDMFKISDGIWLQDTVLQLSYDATYLDFNGLTITGTTSLATAFVSNVTTRRIGTINLIELVVTTFVGTFQISETITATTAAGTIISAALTGMLSDITIVDGGEGYVVDEAVTITDASGVGYGAAAKVKSTSGDQVSTVTVTNVGNGYQVDDPVTFDNTGTNAVVTASAKVATLSNTFVVDVITAEIEGGVETKLFDLSGSFGETVLEGYLLGNNAIYANSTKKGVVISYTTGTPNTLKIYDMFEENGASTITGTLVEWVNGDTIYLFDSNGAVVLGAFSVTINDTSITNPTVHVALDAANYGTGFENPAGTFTSAGTTVTVVMAAVHNLTISSPTNTIKLAFSTSSMDGTYSVVSVPTTTSFTITMSGAAASGTVTMTPFKDSVLKNAFEISALTFGKVASLSFTSHGSGYEVLPTATLVTPGYYSTVSQSDGAGGFYGSNAIISAGILGGSITAMAITESGFGYVVAPTVTAATHSVVANLVGVLGITRIKDGKYSGESGFPSSTKKIQDNNYYQDFSYVLKTTDSTNVWKNDVLKLLHPAGYKLFGEVLIENILNTQMFDRGLNNINSIDSVTLKTIYRDLTFEFSSLLQGLTVSAGDTFLEIEAQIDILVMSVLAALSKVPITTTSSMFAVSALNSTYGIPAHMFSTLYVENVSSVSVGTTTTVTTSTPHYYRENDLVYLDDFVGTGVENINGKLGKATSVGGDPATNNTFVFKETDGTTNVDTAGITITTQGKVFRSGSRLGSGITIDFYSSEYISLLGSKQIHDYEYNSPADLSGISTGDALDIFGRYIDVESHVILEDVIGNDTILLEDGIKPSDAGYGTGETSLIGNLLADEGQISLDGANVAHELAVTAAIQKEVSGQTNNILDFSSPLPYKGVSYGSYPNNLGFGYYKHRVDQRLSV